MKRCNMRQLGLGAALAALAVMGGCPAPDGSTPDGGNGGLFGGVLGGSASKNQKPIPALTVTPGATVKPSTQITMDASASSDPDGDALSFEWTQTAGPAASLSSTTDAVVTFTAPYPAATSELKFSFIVRDGKEGEAAGEAGFVVDVSGDFVGDPQGVAAYSDALTADEAYHLLRRAAFGATPEQVNAAVQRGLNATVDDLLTDKPVPDSVTALGDFQEVEMQQRWLVYLIESPNPLRERLGMFWHDRFATARRVLTYGDRKLAVLHWQMLRNNALGNYRDFLRSLTLDPLMLIWLDGANSPKSAPNENYTREFWELFTLGRDTLYTEQDIREGARAFTGITLLRAYPLDARPIYDLLNHDETPKSIFPGRAGPANYNYESVIDLTLAQPEATRYVARNLFVFFVHDHPSDATIDDLAKSFRDSGFQIAPLVKRILTSQALFSAEAQGNQICSPVEHAVGVARTLDMHISTEDSQDYQLDNLAYDLTASGQELLDPPGVEGWHEGVAWLQDQWVLNRVKALSRTMDFGPAHKRTLPYHLLPDVSTWKQREARDQIVDAIANVFHLKLTQEEHDVYVEVLDQNGWRAFHLEDPRNQPAHVFEMIRLMEMDERVLGR